MYDFVMTTLLAYIKHWRKLETSQAKVRLNRVQY